jgi:hypothetical protein
VSDEAKLATPDEEFTATVARAMADGPLVMCVVAICRNGRSHCLSTFPDATSTDLFEMIGRLQALVTEMSLATSKIEDDHREPAST